MAPRDRRRGALAELAEGMALELADAFPGHTQSAADLLERQGFPLQAEAERQDISLAVRESSHQPPSGGPILLRFDSFLGRAMPVRDPAG